MTKIRMNKEMPLSVEWMPQNAYMHNSLDHLLPGEQNQHNLVFVKDDVEFFETALNSQSVQNRTMRLQISSKEEAMEIKQESSFLNASQTIRQTESLNQTPKKLTDISKRLHNRGRIDVIEMSIESTSDYKYFFVYEDQPSKFVVLKALRSNTAKEVARKLLDVLAIIGAPQVLQSGNGRKFAEQVVYELRLLWNDFLILHGDVPKCEVSCRDFKSLLESWMRKNSTRIWCEGLNSIQILHNSTYCCQNDKVPCDILFGRNVREKFQNLKIEKDTEGLWTEEEWIEYLSSTKNRDTSATVEDTQSTSNNVNHCEMNEGIRDARNQHAPSRDSNANDFFVDIKNERSNVRTTDSGCTDETNNESKTNVDAQSLKCKYCQKQYMKLWHLKNHMRTHKAEQSGAFRCKLCNKSFSVSRLRTKHMKQSHGQGKIADKEEEKSIRNTRSNAEAVNEKRSEATHEASEPEPANDDFNASLDAKDSCGSKTAKNSNQNGKRRSESRVSKIQSALQCKYCKQKFNFPSVLERHMRSHTNERPYVCDVCNKSFKQLGHLSQHSLTHHDYRSFQCRVCGVKFESLDSLKQHAHSHKGDATATTTTKMRDVYRLFECDNCKKVFTTKSVLERHIFTHTQERQYDCKVCGKRFKQAGHVKSHMLVHTGERRFQCTLCSKRFSLSNSLKKHMYVHNGEKPYQCDVCGARFLEKRNLNGHLLTHTNERPYCCKICGKRYTLADTLRRHVSAAHEDGRTYQCEICAKMFKQLAHLSVHKKVHNDERPFQCHLCEKNFKHKNVLKSHLAIHANVRPFECDVCKATFVRKTNLQTHISSAHMNERPYACTICGKRFKQISHLNGHVIVHSNLMPYKCDYCDRRCNRLDNLKKHMRLHTKNKE
nr:PREDICTED: zinc finger protein 678-like [Linepithema humile]XP_012226935.1 PREDICTED: zinc finger protein 678-like [Linepithema humile]